MTYQDKLKKQLSEYKLHELDIAEPGFHKGKYEVHRYQHILPRTEEGRNLLAAARPRGMTFLKANPRKRHQYFHHLNSSQAFTFNLFFPHFDSGGSAASSLLRAFGRGHKLAAWELEAVPLPNEGTNIDASWTTADGEKTICEVKVSENDFGSAKVDARHLDKLSMIYQPVLQGNVVPACLETKEFFRGYQFYRNVWHLVQRDVNRLVFLLPRANRPLWKKVHDLRSKVLGHVSPRISIVAIEDVLSALIADSCNPAMLREHAKQMARKYLISE